MLNFTKHRALGKAAAMLCTLSLLLTFFTVFPSIQPKAAGTANFSLRIEGVSQHLLTAQVPFDNNDPTATIYSTLTKYFTSNGIPYATGDYGSGSYYISSIYGENAGDPKYGKYSGWMYAVNGKSPDYGLNSIAPKNNDNVLLYFGDFTTYLPQITFDPKYPVAGQSVKVHLSSPYTDWYTGNFVPNDIANAVVVCNGVSYTTNSDGIATIKMPDKPGSYIMNISKENSGVCPGIVRTGDFTVTAYDAASVPKDTDESILNLPVTTTPSMSSATVSSEISKTYNDVGVDIPAGTNITGAPGWDGIVHLPELLDKGSVSIPAGFASLALKVGSSSSLHFDKPVTLTMPGQAGRRAGYFDDSNVFHPIEKRSTAPSASELAAFTGETCFDQGSDLVILTTHFTTFTAYSELPSVTDSDLQTAIKDAESFIGSDSSDWSVIALARAGAPVSQRAIDDLAQTVTSSGGSFSNPNTLARLILAAKASGKDPQNFAGVNLIEKLSNYPNIDKTGLNGAAFGLIALQSGSYTLPASPVNTSNSLKNLLLSYQNTDGSFALDKGLAGDPDMTAIAITALSRVKGSTDAANAVTKAVSWLSSTQAANGGYTPVSGSTQASESVSQVIIALSSAGIDPATDLRFIKNGKSLIDNLLSYRIAGSGFAHSAGDTTANLISTQQALMALSAYSRYKAGQPALYDLTNAAATVNPPTGSAGGMPKLLVIAGLAVVALAVSKRLKH